MSCASIVTNGRPVDPPLLNDDTTTTIPVDPAIKNKYPKTVCAARNPAALIGGNYCPLHASRTGEPKSLIVSNRTIDNIIPAPAEWDTGKVVYPIELVTTNDDIHKLDIRLRAKADSVAKVVYYFAVGHKTS